MEMESLLHLHVWMHGRSNQKREHKQVLLHDRRHEHDGFGAGGHIESDAVSFGDAHATQCCSNLFDIMEKISVREKTPFAALVQIDQGYVSALTLLYMQIQRVISNVGLYP